MNKKHIYFFCGLLCILSACSNKQNTEQACNSLNKGRAKETLDSLYKYYSVSESNLLRETYPFDQEHNATYLASEIISNEPNKYSYLWPYSGTFSAVNTLISACDSSNYHNILDNKVLSGLEEYFDSKRAPSAYSSYVVTNAKSDRFYDDNIWLGIDFTDIYRQTKEPKYLEKAKLIWKFIQSGTDDKLGGGIYWCEQKKGSKNTCSNAPGSVYALKLFEATQDSSYFEEGKTLYDWTKANLQDSTDFLYYDNIGLDGKIGNEKYPYNSGQMLQAASLLYKLTNDKQYLTDAQNIAKSGYSYFFVDFETPKGDKFKLLKKTDVWFIAVMFRGYVELYNQDSDSTYIEAFRKNLDYAWSNMRDEKGLFSKDWTGKEKDSKKWLLTQAAFVELYGRMAGIDYK